MPSADKAFLVDSTKLERGEVWGETDKAVHWKGAFAVYGGHGATASSVIVYEIEPGKRLGWHTDATEETTAPASEEEEGFRPTAEIVQPKGANEAREETPAEEEARVFAKLKELKSEPEADDDKDE